MIPIYIHVAGTGLCVPTTRLTSEALDARHGLPAGWLFRQTGVRARFVCDGETQEAMAVAAARQALAEADLQPADVDLVIFGSSVARQPIPATAPLIAGALGIANGGCAAFDVNATCLSFLTGFDIASAFLASGRCRNALVVASEIASRALPWAADPATAGLFGDGAAAAVLTDATAGSGSCIRASRFETHPDGYAFCQLKSGGTAIDPRAEPERFAAGSLFAMQPHDLFRLTVARFPAFVDTLLAQAGWSHADVDLIVPHQASALALRHLVKRCGFPADRVVDIVAHYGNQVAASLPSALHLARLEKRLPRGAKVLLLGTSAGVSFGGIALEV